MAVKNTVNAIEMFGIDSAVIDDMTFTAVNELPAACFMIRIINASNKDVFVSYDGSTEQDYVTQGQTLQLPLQTNSQPSNYVALMAKGTKVYVKGDAGTGTVYLAAYYQASAV